MLVREVMSPSVVTVDAGATLHEVVGKLLAESVGSVVVVDDGAPTGIVTETDALSAAHERGEPLDTIPVADLAPPPLVTTTPDRTVQGVARTMADEGVKKVVVMDGLDIAGIVTLTDIVWHLADIRKEASDLARRDWDPHR